jgi:hypothetical protein
MILLKHDVHGWLVDVSEFQRNNHRNLKILPVDVLNLR